MTGMQDPFECGWYTVREPLTEYAYIKFYPDETYRQVHHTTEYGPQIMYYDKNGYEAGMGVAPQVLLDWAEDGTILGIEILVPGTLIYYKRREPNPQNFLDDLEEPEYEEGA